MILYLDNSFLNRPFDNPDTRINRLEGEVLFLIIDLAEEGKVQITDSSVIEYENSLNPFPDRKAFVIDALHLATAEYANVDLFITSDYNITKKYKGDLKVITPLDFINFYEKPNN